MTGKELPVITEQYEVLHYDQRPILFTGLNRFGQRIIGSVVDTDETSSTLRCFHIIASSSDYGSFLRRQISYLSLIKRADLLYVIDSDEAGSEVSTYLVRPSQVPEKYLPRARSFCPASTPASSTFDYVSTLHGPIPDRHRAEPDALARLLSEIPHFLFDPLRDLAGGSATMPAMVEVLPFAAGSFEVQFSVTFRQAELFTMPGVRERYVRQYLDYCLNHFQREVEQLASGRTETAPDFTNLAESKRATLLSLSMPTPSSNELTGSLLASLERSTRRIDEIGGVVGGDLTSVTLSNQLPESRSVIGIIDSQSARSYERAVEHYQKVTHGLVDDARRRSYAIQVYRFNLRSNSGAAVLFTDAGVLPSVRIKFVGDDEESVNSLTLSMHKNAKISVQATSTKRPDGTVTHLNIQKSDS